MKDAAAGRHPLHVARAEAPAITKTVAVLHGTGEDIGDRFNPAVRMPRKPCQIFVGVVVAEVIEEEKWVVISSVAEPKRPPQLDAGTLESRFGLGNMLDGSDRHWWLLNDGIFFEYTPQAPSEWLSSRSN